MSAPTTPQNIAIFDPRTELDPTFVAELQSVHSHIIAAADLAGLQQGARDIQDLVHRAVEKMPAAELLTRNISMLNDALTRRVIEISSAGERLDNVRWCWISLGSEGRQEQTLSSDQDNGIIFAGSGSADALRESLLPLAGRINDALDACGFPLCKGEVMASNPQWCLSLDEWRERFRNWIIEGEPQALLNASIFFDLRHLYGDSSLARKLGDWLAAEASENSRFLFQMAANALRREAPLGMLRRIVVEKSGPYAGTIDLKVNGATMFVDAARIYSLACRARVTNTVDRLRQAIVSHRLHPRDVDAWIEAFYFIQTLRLKNQHRNYARHTEMHNHVDPNQLEAADRHGLVEALRQARVLQNRLALDYPGSQGI